MTSRVNTYMAVLLITVVGSVAAMAIIRVASNTEFNIVYAENGYNSDTLQPVAPKL